MTRRRDFFGSLTRGAVAAICGAIGLRSARPAGAAEFTARLVEPAPMTIDRAVEVLNRARYHGAVWFRMGTDADGNVFGCPTNGGLDESPWPHLYALKPFEATAIAEKLERERLAAAIGPVQHSFPG